jgi:hypothetical protein
MAGSKQSFAARAKYKGPKAFLSGEYFGPDEDELLPAGFYALDEDGRSLLLRSGRPVRLIHVDLAPDDDEDGKEEFLIAGKKDPPQAQKGRLVELEPENVHAKPRVGA